MRRCTQEVYNSAGSGSRCIVHISCDRFSMYRYHINLGENVAVGDFLPTTARDEERAGAVECGIVSSHIAHST